jgi:hypothetical protein
VARWKCGKRDSVFQGLWKAVVLRNNFVEKLTPLPIDTRDASLWFAKNLSARKWLTRR